MPAGEFRRLSIYIGEADTWRGGPLSGALVQAARARGLIGATVLRAVGGYGRHRHVHDAVWVETEANLPEVVEIVDRAERVAAFLPVLAEMVREGLAVVEDVEVPFGRPRGDAPFASAP